MKNYNKQKQLYCFILLFNVFNSSMTDFTVTGLGTLILCNMQLTMLERFSAILAIIRENANFLKKIKEI